MTLGIEKTMLKIVCAVALLAAFTFAQATTPALVYDKKSRSVSLTANGSTAAIQRFAKNEGPELIGMERYIRILPPELQPYKGRGILLLNTVSRSSSGNGMGQCGSGYEMYLHAVDIRQRPLRQVGKALVGSCWKDLYPEADDGPEDFSAYSIEDGRLRIQLLGRSATLSQDFNQLEFDE